MAFELLEKPQSGGLSPRQHAMVRALVSRCNGSPYAEQTTAALLARHAVRSEAEIGSRVGVLYAVNTAGAIAGTLVAAFWLMPELGLRHTVWVGALLNGHSDMRCVGELARIDLAPDEAVDLLLGAPSLPEERSLVRSEGMHDGSIRLHLEDRFGRPREVLEFDELGRLRRLKDRKPKRRKLVMRTTPHPSLQAIQLDPRIVGARFEINGIAVRR